MGEKDFLLKPKGVYLFGVFLVLVALVVADISCNSQSGNTSDAVPEPLRGDSIKIGVCMPTVGPLAGLAALQAEGIRAAFQMEGAAKGRPVELVFSGPGYSDKEFGKLYETLPGRDHVSAVITCTSAEVVASQLGVFKDSAIPLIVTSPSGTSWKTKESSSIVRTCTTLDDQANASARFVADTLHARKLGVILDVEDATCVQLVSLFSANIVRQGGSIMDVAYVKKNEDPSPALTHLMGEKPDAVYVPFSASTSTAMIIKARAINKDRPMIVSNVQPEEAVLSGAGRSLEGVYVLTDFHEQAVISSLGRKFVKFCHNNMKKQGEVGPSIAMGADAYFLAINLILGSQQRGGEGSTPQGVRRNESILDLSGAGPFGALRSQLPVGCIQKKFMHGANLKYIGLVDVKGLDSRTDVRAQ